MAKAKQDFLPAPHSWGFSNWPAHVWPGDGVKGKRFCRTYTKQLTDAGVLKRPSRDLVVMGEAYTRYLTNQTARVLDFDVPANRPQHASKRTKAMAE